MKLQVKVIDPNTVLYEGEADLVFLPGVHGTLGILPGHTPLFAELVQGEITIQSEEEAVLPIESGIVRVRADIVTILVGL